LQDSSLGRLSDLQEPFFAVVRFGNLQFNIEGVTKDRLLGFFGCYLMLGDVAQVGVIPFKSKRMIFHELSRPINFLPSRNNGAA